MKFVKWNLQEPLKVNKFGFLEPIQTSKTTKPDLIVAPLLAFDKSKNRLGYGKGYYDKFLKKNKKTITIGIAFSFQKYNKIKTSNYDVKLNYILTDKGIFLIFMKILILGDIMGPSGMRAIKERLPELIKDKEIDFVIVNGENAADDGVGIKQKKFR